MFWEYDPLTARRWNRDPVVKPWESPYAAFGNNSIWKTDENGAGAKVKVNKKAGTIDISTTVHVTGGSDEDRSEFVKNANEFVGKMEDMGNVNGKYVDESGKEWNITLHVNYVEGGERGEGENVMDISISIRVEEVRCAEEMYMTRRQKLGIIILQVIKEQ